MWRRIVIALCIRQLPSNETKAVDIDRFCTVNTGLPSNEKRRKGT